MQNGEPGGQRPFTQWGNDDVIYTRQGGHIYALILHPSSVPVVLPAVSSQSASVGKITKVELVENNRAVPFTQSAEGLTLQMGEPLCSREIQDTKLAMGYKVVRISQDKAWFNDDDPGGDHGDRFLNEFGEFIQKPVPMISWRRAAQRTGKR